MKTILKTGLVGMFFCAAMIALADRPLKAQSDYCPGYWWAYGYPYEQDHIPFYASHPPVYYSHPIARAYGWTPFAYPPAAIILPLEDGGPKEIINPFVPPSNAPAPTPNTKAKPSGEQTADSNAATPHLIVNPYVATSLAVEER
ncbi:MAG TPA: hypothetical protein VGY55_01785 [Pirellulales bacterium]|jgi:hypothetical protein|nr:hypothetical protein [Pirellulales bacterium]